MVFLPNGPNIGWHEPPYTWEEEMEFYRRMSPKPGVPMTIYRGPRKAADKRPTRAATAGREIAPK